MYFRMLMMVLLGSFTLTGYAEGLYLQTVQSISLSQEQLKKSLQKVEEHQQITLRGELEVPPFHKRGKVDASLENSFCTTCHMTPPHTKSVRSRTFMNMHTQYIACETCHFRPEGVQFEYQWQDTRDASLVPAKAKLFRQAVAAANKEARLLPTKKVITKETYSINPFYKITPFYQQQAVNLRNDHAFAKETKTLWAQAGALAEKAERRALIHAPLSEKGAACQACHSEQDSLLDLAALGASDYQVEKIQNNIVTQFFSRYKDEEQRIRIMSLLR